MTLLCYQDQLEIRGGLFSTGEAMQGIALARSPKWQFGCSERNT